MQNEIKTLCGVCAALMKEAGLQLRQLPGRTEKVNCENCGRRRFGGVYEIDPSQSRLRRDSSPQGASQENKE